MTVILRDLTPEDGITVTFESSTDLETWTPRPDLVTPDPDQSGVAPGFTRLHFTFPPGTPGSSPVSASTCPDARQRQQGRRHHRNRHATKSPQMAGRS